MLDLRTVPGVEGSILAILVHFVENLNYAIHCGFSWASDACLFSLPILAWCERPARGISGGGWLPPDGGLPAY